MSYNYSEIERNSKKQRPKCAKCRNHGVMVLRLGHKGCCQFDDCTCDLCRQTKVRNEAMAKTMANERRRKKETGRSRNTSSGTTSTNYSYGDRNRSSFSLQLDGYNASAGGSLAAYNHNSVSRTTTSMNYATSNTARLGPCNSFAHVDTKLFATNGYGIYHHHRAPQFVTQPYKSEHDRLPFMNTFPSVPQPHLAMIGTGTNK